MRLLLLLSLFGCPAATDTTDSSGDSGEAPVGCQTISVDPGTLRWEDVEPGTEVSSTVTVANTCVTGEDALVFTATIDEPAFTVSVSGEQTVAAGQSVTLTVTFLAPDNASHYGALVLASNDAAHPESFVALEGLVTTDADGDGFANLGAGGDDCDDTDPTVHPGANEVWYDGVDGDCDGGSDYDQDGDGWPALAYGGNDCNDTNDGIHPGADEALDELDQDCDGMVDEDFVLAGEIVISEVMATPKGVADAKGEWFEVANTGTGRIDLYGWQVRNARGDLITVTRHAEVPGGGQAVIGANADSLTNGGVHVDAEYDPTTFEINSSDTLTVLVDGRTIATASWTTATDGVAWALDPDHVNKTDALDSAWWCFASSNLSATDLGTPAEPNDQCTSVDEDGDGVSEDGGDCDDTDPAVNGDAADLWDGIDNDCDGHIDNPVVTDVATAVITGSGQAYIGAAQGIGTGDVTGDGVDDLVIGASNSSAAAGTVWVIDSSDVIGASAVVSSIDTATLNGDTYSYFGLLPPTFQDYDGDGTADLTVGASPYASIYGGDAVDVFSGGSSLTGVMDPDDARTAIEGDGSYGYGAVRVLTDIDTDGDGTPELLVANMLTNDGMTYYAGKVYLYDGTVAGAVDVDDTIGTLMGPSGSAYLGGSLAAGDLDGDGYDDLVVGAPGVTGAASAGGAVYVIPGDTFSGDEDVGDAATTVIYGATRDDRLGGSVAIGNFDGSGALDLAVSGSGSDSVAIFWDASGLGSEVETTDADSTLSGSNNFGTSLLAGDYDDDGHTDLAVGAPALSTAYAGYVYYWWYAVGTDFGAVYMFDQGVMGAAGDHDTTESFRGVSGAVSGDLFGGVLGAGDFDDDGVTDFVSAAPQGGGGGGVVPGTVYVVLGN